MDDHLRYETVGFVRNLQKGGYINSPGPAPNAMEKLDEILMVVHRIDKLVLKQASILPAIPGKPDAIKPYSPPPPRPPKDYAAKPFPRNADKKGKPKTFSAAECEFLILQVKDVMKFIDDNLEDELQAKDDSMMSCQTLLSALKPEKD